jgi:hypothetical protein
VVDDVPDRVCKGMVVDCLLHDGAGPVWEDDSVTDVNIDDVFTACDINQDGEFEHSLCISRLFS